MFPVVPLTDGGSLGSHEYWERLVASGSRLEPNRSSLSWMPDDPPEPDALAPTDRAFYYDMLAQDLETLTLKRRHEASGLFGVGLQVSDDPPHQVLRVSRLLDINRRNVSDTVRIGDTLYSVNDFQVEMSSIDTVEQLIFGDLSSSVRLTFCDRNRQKYDVVAIRHVPISVWESERVWYEIKPEFQGKELHCDPSIINNLETIRWLLVCCVLQHNLCTRWACVSGARPDTCRKDSPPAELHGWRWQGLDEQERRCPYRSSQRF